MKKIIMASLLTLVFTICAFAEGNTPITGFSGCPGGLYYPDEQICCMPNLECPVGRSAPPSTDDTKGSILADLINMLKNIYS